MRPIVGAAAIVLLAVVVVVGIVLARSDGPDDGADAPCADGPVDVAVTYLRSVLADDADAAARCIAVDATISPVDVSTLRGAGEYLFDQAAVEPVGGSPDTVPAGTVTVRIPNPPTPNADASRPDHASGVLVTLEPSSSGGWYVQDVLAYVSS